MNVSLKKSFKNSQNIASRNFFKYQFIYFLLFALSIHALIIFQINFTLPPKQAPQPKLLDVIINPKITNDKVKSADYYAQSNQIGGGEKESKKKAANVLATAPRPVLKPIKDKPLKQHDPIKPQEPKPILKSELSTRTKSIQKAHKIEKKQIKKKVKPKIQPKKSQKKLDLNYISNIKQQIVDLEADIELKSNIYSKRSKHKYINASTAKAYDAQYIRQWTKKIERIGNLNYPSEARRKNFTGKLIVSVTLSPRGEVLKVKIIKSSKHTILDDAAKNIVLLSSPFAPIPDRVLQGNNALVITRTWLFSQQSSGSFKMN